MTVVYGNYFASSRAFAKVIIPVNLVLLDFLTIKRLVARNPSTLVNEPSFGLGMSSVFVIIFL